MTRYFFSTDGDYLGGFEGKTALALVPEGAIEVPNPPAHGKDKLIDGVIVPYIKPVPLSEQLTAIFESLDDETQADLSPLAAAAKMHLEAGKPDIAKLIIQRATIPAELEDLRTAMLEKFEP